MMPRRGPEEHENIAMEMFYLDDDGEMQDDWLHNEIIRKVDYPNSFTIDEKIMGPIRERNRLKAKAKRKR